MSTLSIAFENGYRDYLKGNPRIPITNYLVLSLTEKEPATPILEAYFKGWHSAKDCNICPRCGKSSLKKEIHTNALSRVCSMYICDSCGTEEALENTFGTLTSLANWPIRNKED